MAEAGATLTRSAQYLIAAGFLLLALVACWPDHKDTLHVGQAVSSVPDKSRLATEVTTPPHTEPPRASRSRVTPHRTAPPAPKARTAPQYSGTLDAAFWRRLANCESPTGRSGTYLGYFQFSRDTARKVGYYEGASYEEQVAMAQRWLAMIGGRGGSRSGWPVCWWRAIGA